MGVYCTNTGHFLGHFPEEEWLLGEDGSEAASQSVLAKGTGEETEIISRRAVYCIVVYTVGRLL